MMTAPFVGSAPSQMEPCGRGTKGIPTVVPGLERVTGAFWWTRPSWSRVTSLIRIHQMPYSTSTNRSLSDVSKGLREERGAAGERLTPVDLAAWLDGRVESLAERWCEAIRDQGSGAGGAVDRVIEDFTLQLTGFLPWMLGPYRDLIEPLWIRTSELFGSIAARRGLAAGEVIEEFQVLRELVIRDLYRDPPLGGRLPLSLREILRLNRGIDRGVTHASVGHTDAMFFEFFETERPVDPSGEALVQEVLDQLSVISDEMEQIVGRARTVELAD